MKITLQGEDYSISISGESNYSIPEAIKLYNKSDTASYQDILIPDIILAKIIGVFGYMKFYNDLSNAFEDFVKHVESTEDSIGDDDVKIEDFARYILKWSGKEQERQG